MTQEKLDKITQDIKENIMRNGDLVYSLNEDNLILLDYIASLHNILYEEVTGERYDYMHHWINKIGLSGVDDDIFDDDYVRED